MSQSVQRRMATGAIWMVLFKLVERGLGLISTLILARLLGPAEFGVIAMAMSFIVMGELLTAFGFDIAIIQDPHATEQHYNTAWTCNFLMGLSVTLLMLSLAPAIADFYGRPEVVWVVCALAFGPLIAGAENIGVVAFRKELDFRREFKFQVSRKFIGFAIVVPLALLLRSYWALVVGILVSKLAGTLISYLMHPFRPRFTLVKFKQLFRFSRWMLLNNVVGFFKERSSDFVIGRLYGAAPLGAYNVAYELAHLPSTEIGAPINRALLPGFAKMGSAPEVKTAYASAVGVLAMLTLPAAAIIFAVAPFLVPVILGQKWLAAVPLMEVFAFNGALLLFHSSISAVLMGRGFAGRVTASNTIYVMVLAAMLALFAMGKGAVGAAYAVLLTTLACTPIYLYQVWRALGIAPSVFARAVGRPLIAALATAALLRWGMPAYIPTMGLAATVGWLAGGVVAGGGIYFGLVAAQWYLAGRPEGAERAVLDRARGFLESGLGRRFSRARQEP